MNSRHFSNGTLVLADRLVPDGALIVENGRIVAVGESVPRSHDAEPIDLAGAFLAPGFVDLHVHGGGGSDFMDLTPEAFRTVCRTHARHGTTSLTPTSTVAGGDHYQRFLELCRDLAETDTGGARIVGSHLYGPYFRPEAKGCHPSGAFLDPREGWPDSWPTFEAGFPLSVSIAPELPDACVLIRSCRERGILVNAGHSYATFEQVEEAVRAGVRHVDHLFCAMSDRARLRQELGFPMRGGLMEATLFFDEVTTEVIADGRHLGDSLLRLAWKLKGPDRLALVTDAMRAVDCPDGEYWFGPAGVGERIRRMGDVGTTLDGAGLASGVMGLDHGLRTLIRATGATLPEAIRAVSLTPARIVGLDREIGSLEVGKRADLVVLGADYEVKAVYVGGCRSVSAD